MRETKRETRGGVAGMKGCVRGNERGSAVKPFAFVRFFFFLRVCVTRAIEELKGARLKGWRRRRKRRRGTTTSEDRSDFISRRLDPRGNPPTIN